MIDHQILKKDTWIYVYIMIVGHRLHNVYIKKFMWNKFKNVTTFGRKNVSKSAPLYRHWGSVQAVRLIGGVEV